MKLPDTRWHTMQQFEHNRLLRRCGFFSEISNLSARSAPRATLRFQEWPCLQLSCTFRYKSRPAVAGSLAAVVTL